MNLYKGMVNGVGIACLLLLTACGEVKTGKFVNKMPEGVERLAIVSAALDKTLYSVMIDGRGHHYNDPNDREVNVVLSEEERSYFQQEFGKILDGLEAKAPYTFVPVQEVLDNASYKNVSQSMEASKNKLFLRGYRSVTDNADELSVVANGLNVDGVVKVTFRYFYEELLNPLRFINPLNLITQNIYDRTINVDINVKVFDRQGALVVDYEGSMTVGASGVDLVTQSNDLSLGDDRRERIIEATEKLKKGIQSVYLNKAFVSGESE